MRFSWIFLIATSLFSCSRSGVPEDVLPPDKIRLVIFDLLRADEYLNNFILQDTLLRREKEAIKIYDRVFAIHKTSPKDFYKSYKYYQAHPDKNKLLIDSLNAYVIRKRGKPDSVK